MFSPSFMVSGLTFKSLIHFEVFNIWCEKNDLVSLFFFYRQWSSSPSTVFSPVYILGSFCHLLYCLVALTVYAWVCFQALYSVSLICVSLLHHHAVLITIALQYSLRSCSMIPLALYIFLKITLNIQVLLWFHTNIRIVYPSSVKNAVDISIGIALNLQTSLGSMYVLTKLILPIYEQIWVIFTYLGHLQFLS